MANRRRGNDGFSSPPLSIDENSKTNFTTTSVNNSSRDDKHRARDETDHPTGTTDSSRETRRDENPFSFKHFLKKDSRPNYNLAGARPKVYSPARISSPDDCASAAVTTEIDEIYPCNPTELPDFVQDHLVIEQCYLNKDISSEVDAAAASSSIPIVSDIENLPDFTLNNTDRRQQTARSQRTEMENSDKTCDMPFHLGAATNERRNRERLVSTPTSLACNNDTSVYRRPDQLPIRQTESMRFVPAFPFDLPSSIGDSSHGNPVGPKNSPANEASVYKSLPDFLNDGPIRNRVAVTSGEIDTSSDITERTDASLLLENERLRDELKIARRHIADRMRMIESLKAELASRRAGDNDETAHLEKAMEQVEVNLKRSTKRATIAESAVASLKHEVKALTAEVALLRSENRELREIAGASGCADYRLPGTTERRMKKFSDDLRAAATSAEGSLRQLMSGVNNLRVMANALENIERIEDRTKEFLPDFEEDNAAGPAL